MDFQLSDEQQQIKQLARKFVAEELRPLEPVIEEKQIIDRDLHKELVGKSKDYGLWNAFVPEKWGGAGITDLMTQTLVREEIGPTSYVLRSYVDSGGMHLDEASDYQRENYFLPSLKGDKRTFAAMTEPDAGSDNGAMKTTARRDGDNWILNGQKHFISGVDSADYGIVYAVTDPEKRKHGGISGFIVEPGMPGFEVGRRQVMMGHHGFNQYVLHFDDCIVPNENMIGGEGAGLRNFLTGIVKARLKVGIEAVGAGAYAHSLAEQYAHDRHILGSTLIEKQGIQWMLIDSMIELQAARLLCYEAAFKADQGQDIRVEASIAKLTGTETAWRVIDRSLQIHGGLGYTEELPLARLLRDARGARIYEGANELQRYVISKARWGVGQ